MHKELNLACQKIALELNPKRVQTNLGRSRGWRQDYQDHSARHQEATTVHWIRSSERRRLSQRVCLSWMWRWMIVHAIGHKLLHSRDHLWMQEHTQLGSRIKREADEFAGTLLMDGREALEHDRVHLETFPSTRRPRGMGHLHGPCDRTTGSAEVCSLLTPPTLTDLSLPTMSFGISLYEAQAT